MKDEGGTMNAEWGEEKEVRILLDNLLPFPLHFILHLSAFLLIPRAECC